MGVVLTPVGRGTCPVPRSRGHIMDPSVLVAIARLPDRGHAIKELARTNDDFRSLCADLADAEAAAVRWEQSGSGEKDIRCAEYRELARELAAELATMLDRHAQ